MSPWDGASRWINTALLVVVGFIGFDTLFRLLEANERNVIVGFTRSVATALLSPFEGMFDDQDYLLTALIAILGYALVAGILLAVIRSLQASRRRRVRRGYAAPVGSHGAPVRAQEIPPPPAPGDPYVNPDGNVAPADGRRDGREQAAGPRRSPPSGGETGNGGRGPHDTAEIPPPPQAGYPSGRASAADPFAVEGPGTAAEDPERTWPGRGRA